MQVKTIAAILAAHSIPFYIKSGRIYADSMEAHITTPEYIDLTDYTLQRLRDWLGY